MREQEEGDAAALSIAAWRCVYACISHLFPLALPALSLSPSNFDAPMATSRPLMRASSAEAAFTVGVLGVAGLLFLHTAYRQLSMARSITGKRNAALTSDAGATAKASSSSNNATTKLTPASKTTRDSSVHVTYPATLDMCDARPPDEHAARAPSALSTSSGRCSHTFAPLRRTGA